MSDGESFDVIKVKVKVISDSLIKKKKKLLYDVIIKPAQLNIWNVDTKITWVNWRLIEVIKKLDWKKLLIRNWDEMTVKYFVNKYWTSGNVIWW